MDREIYLDNNASTRPLTEVRAAVLAALGSGLGNPASAHQAGERARVLLEEARERVSTLLGASPERIVFTSGGTEANSLVLRSATQHPASQSSRPRIITTAIEHSSVLRTCEYLASAGVEVVVIPVGSSGRVAIEDIQAALTPSTALVSVQWVNNETGVIQPIEEIAELCHSHEILFHSDAAQAIGKIPFNLSAMSVDFLTLTAHKFHGPQGVGAVYVAPGARLRPQIYGGPQERGSRAGTENLPGILGMGAAARVRAEHALEVQAQLATLRGHFEQRVLQAVPGCRINGNPEFRVCNTTNLLFEGIDGQALVARLDLLGIRCSQSSACTNQRPEPSYVLRAMGLSEEDAYSSVRFSFAVDNTLDEAEEAALRVGDLCTALSAYSTRHPASFATSQGSK